MKEEYNEKTIIKNLLYHERLLWVRFLDWPTLQHYCDFARFREEMPHIFRSCVGKISSSLRKIPQVYKSGVGKIKGYVGKSLAPKDKSEIKNDEGRAIGG